MTVFALPLFEKKRGNRFRRENVKITHENIDFLSANMIFHSRIKRFQTKKEKENDKECIERKPFLR